MVVRDYCEQCEDFNNMCIRDKKCVKTNGDLEQCDECGHVCRFDALPDDAILMQREGMVEYWGAMVPLPDSVAGYVCPFCGHENRF